MKEIRWHARAGQGAKTASQLLALASLHAGSSVQAFPEYGPERRGAPMRVYNRVSDTPIRRHDPVAQPDIVVVLEPSLVNEMNVTEGMAKDGLVIIDSEELPAALEGVNARCVPANTLAEKHGMKFVNLVMVGAVAKAIGEPLQDVQEAAVALLGKKVPPEKISAVVEEGYKWLS
ncbi:MAG: 2-oxoacid:acceptor oxidoreductase family protein [Gaiellaceae bacterium]